jgi:hypothetical protein
MSWTLSSLLRGFRGRAARHVPSPRRPPRFRPRLEELEGRWVPSTLTVTSPAGSGPGSLPDTVSTANSGDSIVFDRTAFAGQTTITLGNELLINKSVTITGPGPDG